MHLGLGFRLAGATLALIVGQSVAAAPVSALKSRAIAGVHGRALVAALPGSTKAVRLGLEKVLLPIARHTVGLL